jgi:hypothetical protein
MKAAVFTGTVAKTPSHQTNDFVQCNFYLYKKYLETLRFSIHYHVPHRNTQQQRDTGMANQKLLFFNKASSKTDNRNRQFPYYICREAGIAQSVQWRAMG